MLKNLEDLYGAAQNKEDVDSIMTEYMRELQCCRDWIERFQMDHKDANDADMVNVSNLLVSMPKLSNARINAKKYTNREFTSFVEKIVKGMEEEKDLSAEQKCHYQLHKHLLELLRENETL